MVIADSTKDLIWCARAAFVVCVVIALTFFLTDSSALVPIPIYQVILLWTFPLMSLVALPLVYFATAYFGLRSSAYPKLVLGVVAILSMLDIGYFRLVWNDGIQWQGQSHTLTAAVLNGVCFGLVGVTSAVAVARNSVRIARVAHLALFIVLSWCAFPYLGELP